MSDLADRACVPCREGTPRLRGAELAAFADRLGNGWEVVDEHHLRKEYRFPDFRRALDFTVQLGELAESLGHHPEIGLAWGRVTVTLWTHKIGGLAEADFVWAAKADRLPGAG